MKLSELGRMVGHQMINYPYMEECRRRQLEKDKDELIRRIISGFDDDGERLVWLGIDFGDDSPVQKIEVNVSDRRIKNNDGR